MSICYDNNGLMGLLMGGEPIFRLGITTGSRPRANSTRGRQPKGFVAIVPTPMVSI